MGTMTCSELAPGRDRSGVIPRSLKTAELAVSERVEDKGEKAPRRGDLRDPAPASACDAGHRLAEQSLWSWRCTASTTAQRTRRLPCLVIEPRCTVVSDSRWRGVRPAQEQSLSGEEKREMSPISVTRTAANTGPMPGSSWSTPKRGSLRSRRWISRSSIVDLAVEDLDQVPQRLDADREALARARRGRGARSGDAEEVAHRDRHPLFREHGVDLLSAGGPEADELVAVADELALLSQLRGRDVGLDEASEAVAGRRGQSRHARRSSPVAIAPVVAERVSEVDMGALRLEEVDEPVPAVGRLDDRPRVRGPRRRARPGCRRCPCSQARTAERVTPMLIPSHDDRPAAVQVDADILLFHRGSPSSLTGWFADLECVQHSTHHDEVKPRPFVEVRLIDSSDAGARCRPIDVRHAGAALRSFITSTRRWAYTIGGQVR